MNNEFSEFAGLTPAQLAAKLNTQRTFLRILYLTFGFVWLVALLLYFKDTRLMILVAACNLLVGVLLVSPQHRRYRKSLAHGQLVVGLGAEVEQLTHSTKGGFTEEQLDACELVPRNPKGSLVREQVTGSVGGLPITLSDVTLPYDSHAQPKSRVECVCGCMAMVELPRNTGLDLRLVDRRFYARVDREAFFLHTKGLEAQELEDEALEARFALYYRAGTPAGLPKGMLKRIAALGDYTPGELALSIQGSRLTIIIKRRFLSLPDISLKQTVGEKLLAFNPFPEVKYIEEIAKFELS